MMNKIERLFLKAETSERTYNMLPKKSAEFTIEDFFNESKLHEHKSGNTSYVVIGALFHEIDGQIVQSQKFNLQLPLINGFPNFARIFNSLKKESGKNPKNVRIKLKRPSNVVFLYSIVTDTDKDTYTNTNTDTYTDTSEGC